MMLSIINAYCNYIIFVHEFIKQCINQESLEEYILSLTRYDALQFIESCYKSKIKLYPTRKERYLLYKQLKGRNSPVELYSYGKEKSDTRKYLIIIKKNKIDCNE